MLLAVALQLIGVALVSGAAFLAVGVVGPLAVVGVVAFAAGVVREHGGR